MNHYDQTWLQRPNVTRGRVLFIVCLCIGLLSLFDLTKFAADIENKLSNPLLFRTRDQIGRSPVLDPRIKVFVVDDKSISWMKSPELSLDQWADVLSALDMRHPKAIIIDKMFSLFSSAGKTPGQIRAIIKKIEEIRTPIIVGAFVAPQQIKFREPLPLIRDYNELSSWLPASDLSPAVTPADVKLPITNTQFVYGPDPQLRVAFPYIGHLLYDGDGRIRPVLRLSEQTVLPHFMTLAAEHHQFGRDGLYLNDRRVSTRDDGGVLLDFSPFSYYLSRVKTMQKNLELIGRGQPFEGVTAGDYVYIIPEFYTGSTDFKLTPFGHMPAGCAHLAMLNSMVTGKWLRDFHDKYIFMLVAAVLGALIAINFNALGVTICLTLGTACWLVLAILLFVYADLVINWLLPTLAYLFCLIGIFIEKSRVAEHKAQFIRSALDGFVAPDHLDMIAQNPEKLNFEAKERVVTVMFIDVVGFSLVARYQLPRVAFDTLKEVLNQIVNTVHEHGGIVNKNLGDGLLCFFGYSFEKDETTLNHAQKAVGCAMQIQKQNLARTLTTFEGGDLIFPLRIGINTSSAYLGNLGTAANIDFTIIGNGVNFAKRLEGSCHPHLIMLGETTKELITPLGSVAKNIEQKFIKIKHHNDLMQAYSLNPFLEEPELFAKAMEAYQISLGRVRKQERMLENHFNAAKINTNYGVLKLIDLTADGFTVIAPGLLPKGTVINMMLDKGGVAKSARTIADIAAEVVWAYEEPDGSLHEIRPLGVNEEELEAVRTALRELLKGEIVIAES